MVEINCKSVGRVCIIAPVPFFNRSLFALGVGKNTEQESKKRWIVYNKIKSF